MITSILWIDIENNRCLWTVPPSLLDHGDLNVIDNIVTEWSTLFQDHQRSAPRWVFIGTEDGRYVPTEAAGPGFHKRVWSIIRRVVPEPQPEPVGAS